MMVRFIPALFSDIEGVVEFVFKFCHVLIRASSYQRRVATFGKLLAIAREPVQTGSRADVRSKNQAPSLARVQWPSTDFT